MKFSKIETKLFKPVTISITVESEEELNVLKALGSIEQSIANTVLEFCYFGEDQEQNQARIISENFCEKLREILENV